jgi:uroporphyrinogen decarboxylase
VLPHSTAVFAGVADLGVPRIHFGVDTGELLGSMAEAGADVVGVDWRVTLDAAARRLDAVRPGVAMQGNLDPAAVVAGWAATKTKAAEVIAAAGDRPGHVFNLGHGVLPETDPSVLERLVAYVHGEDPDA